MAGSALPESALPALLGGEPVQPGGPPAWPRPDAEVEEALRAAMASGAWAQYHGEQVCSLESELARYQRVPHALTCASGTLAVEAALRALRVGPGDEVILAAYEYESTFLTLHAMGAKPVLVDVASGNFALDPGQLEAAITPRSRAVVCSHLHGGLVPMREVMEIARARGIGVVEDAAQAAGAMVQGKPAGSWGDVGTLSFGGSKLLAAGRGGALVCEDPRLFQRARLWLHRGVQQWAPLSELQAAAVRPQLRRLEERTRQRLEAVQLLAESLGPACGLVLFENEADDQSVPAYYKLGFRYDTATFGLPRDIFVKAMRAEGIALDAGFNALHINRSPSRYRAAGPLTRASLAHESCVVLHHPVLLSSRAEVLRVAEAATKLYRAVIHGLWPKTDTPDPLR